MNPNEYDAKLKFAIRKRMMGVMTPTENVLYFPNNLDVRLCPKNGITSLKYALKYILEGKEEATSITATKSWRKEQIKQNGYRDDLPYRENSYRLAISRDPVRRFLSAAEYLNIEWAKQVNHLGEDYLLRPDLTEDDFRDIGQFSEAEPIPNNLDELIEAVSCGDITNTHFYSQTYYLGARGQYDRIYKMSNFTDCLEFIRRRSDSSKSIDKLRANRTHGKIYGTVDDLTQDQKKRIMKIYEVDYDYGWTENSKPL